MESFMEAAKAQNWPVEPQEKKNGFLNDNFLMGLFYNSVTTYTV
jgi:hypothetical protein